LNDLLKLTCGVEPIVGVVKLLTVELVRGAEKMDTGVSVLWTGAAKLL